MHYTGSTLIDYKYEVYVLAGNIIEPVLPAAHHLPWTMLTLDIPALAWKLYNNNKIVNTVH